MCCDVNLSLRTVVSPYDDGEELVAVPALRLDAALVHVNRADARGSGQILGPDPFFDELFLGAAERRFVTTERLVDTGQLAAEGPLQTMCISRLLTDGVIETPRGAHFTACVPDYPRDEAFQRDYAAAAADPESWAAFEARVPRPSMRAATRPPSGRRPRSSAGARCRSDPGVTRAEYCVIACAEVFRGDGEVMASAFGTAPSIGARLARLTFAPDLVLTDGDAALVDGAPPIGPVALHGARVAHALPAGVRGRVVGAAQPDHDGLPDRPHRQPEHQCHRRVGPAEGSAGGGPGSARATPSTTPPATGCRSTAPAPSSSRSTWSPGWATPGPRRPGRPPGAIHEIRRVVSDLGVFDFETPDRTMRLRSLHPGVTVDEVIEGTGFGLVIPPEVPETRLPTPEELHLIRDVLDPRVCATRSPVVTAVRLQRPVGPTPPSIPASATWSAWRTPSCRPAWAGWPARGWWPPPPRPAGSGILASATMTYAELATAIAEVRDRTDRPFGVNLRTDVADVGERVALMIDNGVKVASFAQAPTARLVARCREAGLVVMPTVGARRHAEKVAEWGVDAVIAQGGEGGGHTGSVPTSLLTPAVVDAVGDRVAVVAAGGFFDGRGLVAALAYGAVGIAMGTRFLLTRESRVPDQVKEVYLSTPVTGTVVSTAVDGAPQRVIRTDLVDHLERSGWLRRMPRALMNAHAFRRQTHTSLAALLRRAGP